MNRRAFFGLFRPAVLLAPGIALKHNVGSAAPAYPDEGPMHTLAISITEEVSSKD